MQHSRQYIPPKSATSRRRNDGSGQRLCHRCRGTGQAPCTICKGSGRVMTGRDGNGHPVFGRCDGCLGTKTARCHSCGGSRFL